MRNIQRACTLILEAHASSLSLAYYDIQQGRDVAMCLEEAAAARLRAYPARAERAATRPPLVFYAFLQDDVVLHPEAWIAHTGGWLRVNCGTADDTFHVAFADRFETHALLKSLRKPIGLGENGMPRFAFIFYIRSVEAARVAPNPTDEPHYAVTVKFASFRDVRTTCTRLGCARDGDATRVRQRCTGCRHAYYCSQECLKDDWPRHKPYCMAARALAAASGSVVVATSDATESLPTEAR